MAFFGDQGNRVGDWRSRAYSSRKPSHLAAASRLNMPTIAAIWLVCSAIVGTASYWAYDTIPPMQVLKSTVVPDSGVPGSRVTAYFRARVTRNCTLDIEKAWVDSKENVWPGTTAHLNYDIGTYDIGLTSAVPMDAWAGKATLSHVIVYQCNPLQYVFPRRQIMPSLTVDVVR